jgi:hypothetical protein
MLIKCSLGPFNMAKEHMNMRLPMVNERANFCGLSVIVGKPTKKASAKNSAERNNMAQKTCIKVVRNKEHVAVKHFAQSVPPVRAAP